MLDSESTRVKVTTGDGETLFEGVSSDMHKAAGKVREHFMKETAEDRAVSDAAYGVAADELRAFVERYERLESEKADITDQQKEVMGEAKGRGYDTKILKKVIALRKRDRDDVAEEEAILAMYRSALGL